MAPGHRTRSPLRERERPTSPQRGDEVDYGHDADKHVRHIARTRQLTTFAGKEGIPRDWRWVLQGLVHRRSDRGTGCPVNILNTIIYYDGSPEMLYYTSGGNDIVSTVISDDEGCITFAKAMMHLRLPKTYVGAMNAASTQDSAAGGGGTNEVAAFTSTGEAVAIKTADATKIRKGQSTPPTGTEALVLLVPMKAPSAELLLSIQHTFILEPCAAKPVHRSYRLVVLKGVPTRVPCHSSTIDKKLCRLCKQVVLWIEAYSGARVLRLVLELVEDIYGHLWLVRSSECSTTKPVLPYSLQRRSPSPAQSKTARLQSAKDIADELSLLRYGHAIGESAPSHKFGLDIQTGPEPGCLRRAQTAMSPAEAGSSKGTLDADEWGFKTSGSPSGTLRDSRRPHTVSTRGSTSATIASTSTPDHARGNRRNQEGRSLQDIGVTFKGFAAPGEHDPREIGRTAAAGRALGSSQLSRKCHGDFCNTDLLDKIQQQARFEQEETGNGSLSHADASPAFPSRKSYGDSAGAGEGAANSADTSAFRTRILKLDEATLQDHGVLPAEGGLMQSQRKNKEKSTRRGGGRRGTDDGREGSEIRGFASGRGNTESAEWKEVPLSWIVRGRQESHLVDQQLRRYRRGNKEPFVGHLSGLGESSVSLGAAFPATYYQPVRVCCNCYRVYSMIDEARTKSVKRLDERAAAAAAAATRGGVATRLVPESRSRNNNRPQWSRAAKRARGGTGPRRASHVRSSSSSVTREQEDNSWSPGGRRSQNAVPTPGDDPVSSFVVSGTGEGELDKWDEESESVSGESLALMRAQAAIDELTRGDICELRSFAKPPAAVNMAAAALMIALTGHGEPTAAGWLSAKRYMTNVDKLFGAVAGLDLSSLRVSQTRKLEAYVRNPAFRPDVVACVSLPASKICAWVLGVLEAHNWRTGRGHPRSDILGQTPGVGGGSTQETFTPTSATGLIFPSSSSPTGRSRRNDDVESARPWTSAASTTTPSRVGAALGPAVYPFPSSTTDAAAATTGPNSSACSGQRRRGSRRQVTAGGDRRARLNEGFPTLSPPELPPQAWIPAGVTSGSGAADPTVGSPDRVRTAPATGSGPRGGLRQPPAATGSALASGKRRGGGQTTTRAGRAAAKRQQDRVGERLANATAAAPDPAGFEGSELLCADGVTLLPYAVVGKGAPLLFEPATTTTSEGEGLERELEQQAHGGGRDAQDQGYGQDGGGVGKQRGVLSFVVVHDFFDTLEKTFLLFKPLVLKYPGCQVLCFNSPGQAGTRLPPEPEGLLTNTWVADRLDELMQHVDNMGEMALSDRPFHLLGIGNGASIAAAFACKHASKSKWRPTLRSLVSVNGFATIDAQLAAVLHSAQRAFQCFPPERPDLPISFWSRFVFSEEYLKSIGSDLALNILCAVANPLGAEGMLRIVKGALKSRDLTKELKAVAVPFVLVQSTENMLIDAANVDPFLEGRRPRHIWSHQLRLRPTTTAGNGNGNGSGATFASCLGQSGEQALFESLSSGAEGAFVAWVKGGHETRQECKRLVVDVLDLLAVPGGQAPGFFRRGALARRSPGGRVGIAAATTASKTAAAKAKVTGPTAPAAEKDAEDGGSLLPSAVGNGDSHPALLEDSERNRGPEVDETTVIHAGTAAEVYQQIEEQANAGQTVAVGGAEGDGTKGAAAEEGGASGLTYGYASLRKIREREPLPEFPKSCGRSKWSPTASRASSPNRALTAPVSPGKRTRNGRRAHRSGSPDVWGGHDRQGRGRSPSRAATARSGNIPPGLGDGDAGASDWMDVDEDGDFGGHRVGDDGGGAVVTTLEEAVADFDVALRDHRSRRRGLGSTSAGLSENSANHQGGGEQGLVRVGEKEAAGGGGVGPPPLLHNTGAGDWLDGEAMSWATVDLGMDGDVDDPREWSPGTNLENEKPLEAAGNNVNLYGISTPRADLAARPVRGAPHRTPPTRDDDANAGDAVPRPDNIQQVVHDEELGRTPEGSLSLNPPPPSPERPERSATSDGAVAPPGTDAAVALNNPGGSRPSSPPVSVRGGTPRAIKWEAAAEGAASSVEEHVSTALLPCSPSTTERAAEAGTSSIGREEIVHAGVVVDTTSDLSIGVQHEASADREGATAGGKEMQQVSLGSPPAAVTAAAAVPSVPYEDGVVPKAAVGDTTLPVPASKIPEAAAVPATTASTAGTPVAAATAATAVVAPQTSLAMKCADPVATVDQRTAGDWMEGAGSGGGSQGRRLPAPLAIAEAEAELAKKVERLQSKRLAAERDERGALDERRAAKFGQERASRAEGFADEDRKSLAEEERRLAELRRQADLGRLQRGAEFQETDEALALGAAKAGVPSATTGATPMPVRGMRPQHFAEQEDLPEGIKKTLNRPADKVLDEMQGLEARAKAAGGGANLEVFERVEQRQLARQVERLEILHGQTAEEKSATVLMMVARLQMFARQRVARQRVARLRRDRSASKGRVAAAITMQSLVRGHLARTLVRRARKQLTDEMVLGGRATLIQKMYRGRLARLVYYSLIKDVRVRMLQRAARGFLGRRVAARKREQLARFAARVSSATKLQSAWRGKMARDSYLRARCSWLASREIQRLYRGHLGRRAAIRRREWQSATPGPERLKMGLRMIEDTKVAFTKQQGEIAALSRAQEKAEARVSSIHHQLTVSESELSVLEGEMAEIDHIERELVQLTHERDLIGRGITGAAGIRKTGKPRRSGDDGGGDDSDGGGGGGGGGSGGGSGSGGRAGGGGGKTGLKKEDAYALEMQLQLKRAEREQRRLQLSVEFASTFADVSEKKRQLDRLSAAVADIEATRLRKSREFGHMQRNLMELLSEQKRELDIVREKGVQLETAAATSAAAAAATAQRARDHEAKAAAMYGQTEELMKFQFMSMSLSYFSSLNMMKQMRDINADTTTAAIAGSADAAAAAAASAAAASIPSLKDTGDLGGDAVSQALAARREQVKIMQAEIEEAKESQRHPFPTELSLWTVDDVCRWLDTLQLGEYKQAFREGKVDGSFLGELRESDLMDSIGMEHKLHLKKLLLARQKLTPLSAAEQSMASSVRREDSATATREEIPDIDTAFSQARHGKKKRLEETLNAGFDINAEDHLGNTLLLVAVQQQQMPVVEFLVQRGANVNHSNAAGNTSLHFAMSYDTSGKMGEYLINNGADDTIENKQGLSPYDGI